MKVFNVTAGSLVYRGKTLAPGAGIDFPELDTFVPDRDKKLVQGKIISLGSLPRWYVDKNAVRPPPVKVSVAEEVPVVDQASVQEVAPSKDWVEKPIGKKK